MNLNRAKELKDKFEYGWNYEEINPITKEAHENNCKQEAKQLKEKVEKGCGKDVLDNNGRPCLPCGDVVGEMGDYTKATCKDCLETLKILNEILGEKE